MKKRILALALAVMMSTVLAACRGNATDSGGTTQTNSGNDTTAQTPADNTPAAQPASAPTGTKGQAKYDAEGNRIIRIATWYQYNSMYTSGQQPEDLPEYATKPESFGAMYDNLKAVEQKYKVKFEFVRTTFDGIQVSLDEGVLSGKPDADIYEADIQYGMPAALNGYCYDVNDLAAPDSDIFTKQNVFVPLTIPSLSQTYLWSIYQERMTVYALGFNWTLLQAKGLENPQDLYDRGEWTWDKFIEYTTKMTDLTANPPVYGFSGLWNNHLNGFLRSNAAQIAATKEGGLTSSATGEVLDLFKRLYVDLKVGRPWDSTSGNWALNNTYGDGSAAFFTAADWIFNEGNGLYGGGTDYPLNYELGLVPYPVGPNGNKETNFHNYVQGNYYLIPKGVEDPATVYNAFCDLVNWYGGDYQNTKGYDVLDADDVELNWSQQQFTAAAHGNAQLAANNVRLGDMMMQKISFDPWENLGINAGDDGGDFGLVPILDGDMTPAQFVETFKQPLADALKTIYK